MKNLFLSVIGCIVFIIPAFAQEESGSEEEGVKIQTFSPMAPRREDHFWRRKVVNRIDLNEKMNAPFIKRESPHYADNDQYSEKEGIVMALFNGLKAGKYNAYDPDSLSKPMAWEDVLQKIREKEGELTGEGGDFDGEGDGSDFEEYDSDGEGFEEEDYGGFDEDFEDEFGGDAGSDDLEEDAAPTSEFDSGPYESVIQFVENRIFDKVRSDMVYDIEYVEIIWTDPGEALPEEKLCTFRYKEILETLETAQWKNRFNDAEYRNLREAFELRLFHSYIIDISSQGMRTKQEAEYRRQKLVEFEHHLWSY